MEDYENAINWVKQEKQILQLIKDAKETLTTALLAGEKIPGVKLILSSPHRKYKNEVEARETLIRQFTKSEVIEEKLISPAKLDGLIESRKMREATKLKLVDLYEKPKGQPKLALSDDPGQEYNPEPVVAENYEETETMLLGEDLI